MSLQKLASTFAVLSLSFVFGCSPDCRSDCEKAEEADCLYGPDTSDCEKECLHMDDLITNAECQEDYDALLDCRDGLDDICDAYEAPCVTKTDCDEPECDSELEDVVDCITDYCEENPRNNECEALVGGAK